MNDLQVLNFEDAVVRSMMGPDGEPRWVAVDVARAIGLRNPENAARRVDDEDKGWISNPTPGGNQDLVTVNESGLYTMILGSRKDSARRFKKWITSEVLPAIRKTGKYEIPGQPEEDAIVVALRNALLTREATLVLERRQAVLEQSMAAVERQAIEAQVTADEAKLTADSVETSYLGRTDFRTILGYARAKGYSLPLKECAAIGKIASRLCREQGIEKDSVTDERWNSVNSYPISLLETLEPEFRARSDRNNGDWRAN